MIQEISMKIQMSSAGNNENGTANQLLTCIFIFPNLVAFLN